MHRKIANHVHNKDKNIKYLFSALLLLTMAIAFMPRAQADETCLSPYMAKITGQEQFMYIWTLGHEGMGDESDKLVTVDVDPNSETYGEVISHVSVGERGEAHHMDFTDDRRYLWAGTLDTNKIFIFDVHTDPANPKLHKVIEDFTADTGGLVGPHTPYAVPGRMLVSALSNDEDFGGRTGMAEYTNDGEYIATYWNPTDENLRGATKSGKYADGFGYAIHIVPHKNTMISTSFTGWNNYMMDLGELVEDEEAMKQFGNTAVIWDLHTRQPEKILDVPGAPLEIRCSWLEAYCFTTAALTSKIWLFYPDEHNEWHAEEVGTIGNPEEIPLPVDITLTADGQTLWINTFLEGATRAYDVSDPHNPKEIYKYDHGNMVNMHSLSWDGSRVYVTTSLLSKWDKTDDGQFLRAYDWDGEKLTPKFEIDFHAKQLGSPHLPRFGSRALYANNERTSQDKSYAQTPATMGQRLVQKLEAFFN